MLTGDLPTGRRRRCARQAEVDLRPPLDGRIERGQVLQQSGSQMQCLVGLAGQRQHLEEGLVDLDGGPAAVRQPSASFQRVLGRGQRPLGRVPGGPTRAGMCWPPHGRQRLGRARRRARTTPGKVGVDLANGLQRPPRQRRPLRGKQTGEDGVPGEGMAEAEAVPVDHHQLVRDRGTQMVEGVVLGKPGDDRKQRPVEPATQHGGGGQETPADSRPADPPSLVLPKRLGIANMV
jgi:hypothetical protein